jgi:hypothetical protein
MCVRHSVTRESPVLDQKSRHKIHAFYPVSSGSDSRFNSAAAQTVICHPTTYVYRVILGYVTKLFQLCTLYIVDMIEWRV